LPDTLNFCSGDSAYIEIKQTLENRAFISWSTPQGIITNTKKISVFKQGKYFVTVNSSEFSKPINDSCFVRVYTKLKPLMRDTFLCKGKSMILDAKHTGYKYFWSTGETGQRIKIENAGRYWVKLFNGSCLTTNSITVKSLTGPSVYLPSEITFCLNETQKIVTAKAGPGTRMLWNTGATSSTIEVAQEGMYSVKSVVGNCGQQVDSILVKFKVCECEMIIPNSFTPNEDGRNDYFFPVAPCEYSYYHIMITDRWGNTVYTSNNINGKWDGRFKGNLCPEDNYTYVIESKERGGDKKKIRQGQIALFR